VSIAASRAGKSLNAWVAEKLASAIDVIGVSSKGHRTKKAATRRK
jgi:hypothetical protein